MLEVGALTTMTPVWVAALTSTLSRPTPARATTLSRVAAASASASTLVAERTRIASTSAMAGEQLGAVGAVAVPDLEVGAERLDGGGAQLFGDEYDGLGHSGVLAGCPWMWDPCPRGPEVGPAWRVVHDAVPEFQTTRQSRSAIRLRPAPVRRISLPRGHPLTTPCPPPPGGPSRHVREPRCPPPPPSPSPASTSPSAPAPCPGLDLVLAAGDVTALVGANGSGKSSLMRTRRRRAAGRVRLGPAGPGGRDDRLAAADAAGARASRCSPTPGGVPGWPPADRALHDASEALATGRRARTRSTPRRSSAGWRSAPPTSTTGCRRSPASSVSTSTRTGRWARSPAARRPAPPSRRCCSAGTTCCCSTSRPTTSTRTGSR